MSAVQGRFEDNVGTLGFFSGLCLGAVKGAGLGSAGGPIGMAAGGVGGAIIGLFTGLIGGEAVGKAVDGFFRKGEKVDQFMDTVNAGTIELKSTVTEVKNTAKHVAETVDSGKQLAKKSFSIFMPSAAISILGIIGHYFTSSPDCKTISCQWENSDYVPAASGSVALFGMVTIAASFVYLAVRDICFNK